MLLGIALTIVTTSLFASESSWDEHLRSGRDLIARGELGAAEASLKMAIREARKGPANEGRVALSYNELGALYLSLGRYSEAEPLLREALRGWERTFGRSGPGLARIVNNLARLYLNRAQLGKAERLCGLARTLQARQEDSARLLVNLGALYMARGKFADAESAYREAEAIWERTAASELEASAVLNNLGVVYQKSGRAPEAIVALERALAVWTRVSAMDDGSPRILANLGTVYASVGRQADAERAFQNALTGMERYPDVAYPEKQQTLLDYARLLRKLKRPHEARQLEAQARFLGRKLAQEDLSRHTVDAGDFR